LERRGVGDKEEPEEEETEGVTRPSMMVDGGGADARWG